MALYKVKTFSVIPTKSEYVIGEQVTVRIQAEVLRDSAVGIWGSWVSTFYLVTEDGNEILLEENSHGVFQLGVTDIVVSVGTARAPGVFSGDIIVKAHG